MTNVDNSREFERDEYSPDEQDLEAYEYDEEESGVRMPLMLIFGLVAIALAVAAYFFGNSSGYDAGLKAGQQAAVRSIGSGPAGTRERPVEPGGLPEPGSSDVYGTDSSGGETVVSREEPIVELPGGSETPSVPAPGSTDVASVDPEDTVPLPPEPVTIDDDGAVAVPPPPSGLRPGTTSDGQPAVESPTTRVTFPDEQPVGPQPAPATPAPSGSAPAAATSGNYVVQVASLPSPSAVDQHWSRLQARFPDLLGSATKDVEVADLGDRGIYHRLRVGYYAQRSEAVSLCETLKSRGQDCLVRRR